MKKINIYKIYMLLVASLLMTACIEEKIADFEHGVLEPLVINATPKITRTALAEDGNSIVWQKDDEIAVYDFTVAKHKFAIESFDGSKARFLGKITAKKENFLVLYPFNLAAENLTADNKISVALPTEQTATINTFASSLNISAGKGKRNVDGSPSVLTFYNVCQLLKFEVPDYAAGKIKSIKFAANTPVAGTLTIYFSGDIPSSTIANDGSKEITITPPAGATFFAAGAYYVVCAPVQLDGFTMSFTCDGTSYSLGSSSTFGGEAGQIYSLGKIDLVNTPQATAKHVYNGNVLMGTKLTIGNSPVEGREWTAVVKNAGGAIVRTLQGTGTLTSTEEDASWPYLPQGNYSVEYSFASSNGKTITKSISFAINEKPTFTVGTYAYTSFSYYKGDGVTKDIDRANGLNNMTIYEPRITINGIDSKILNSPNYVFTSQISNVNSSVKGRKGAVITYNDASVSDLGSYSLTGLVTFDGASYSAVKTVYITGIPYNATPPSKSNGWSGTATWNSDHVHLRNQTVSKSFYCSEDINVSVIHTVVVESPAFTKAKYTLKCSDSSASVEASMFGKVTKTDAANSMILKSSNPKVSCASTSGSTTNVNVYRIAVEYR